MDIQVTQTLFDAIDSASKSQMTNMNTIMSVMGIVFGGVWVVYFQMKSLYWYFDGLTAAIKDIFFTMFKGTIIFFMAFTVSWYTTTVIPVVTEFPLWLGNTIAGTENGSKNLVDSVISSYLDGLISLIDSMEFGWSGASVKALLLGVLSTVIYLLGGLPFLGVAVGTLITLKVATTLILTIGPIFIAFLLFPQTNRYFWGWVGTLGGFVLTQALFVIVLGMEIAFINNIIIKGGDVGTDLASCLAMLFYFGAFTLLATELPSYAASIMGGASSGTSGVGGILGKTTGAGAAGQMSRALGNKLINKFHSRGKGNIS
ncbi:conjugal transfer protein [Pectobacterium carotovorum]|uniref:type IV secretion system protein n=1 Tax=Pectobacterium versatile TaxID=2488639 RepID=UPI000C7EFA21|nr:type IV secretion system protein [Pectobacterium versatile]PLY35827.1 conjugal transfer protein [Pectobacterium carotovorum]